MIIRLSSSLVSPISVPCIFRACKFSFFFLLHECDVVLFYSANPFLPSFPIFPLAFTVMTTPAMQGDKKRDEGREEEKPSVQREKFYVRRGISNEKTHARSGKWFVCLGEEGGERWKKERECERV